MFRILQGIVLLALLAGMLPAQSVVHYHGVTPAQHSLQANTLSSLGYRPRSISVAGSLATHTVSAVWVQKPGPVWAMSGPLDQGGFTSWRLGQLLAGRRAQLVTASGSGTSTVYMGVYVADGVTGTYFQDQSPTAFETQCAVARNTGRWVTSLTMHGTATAPLYSFVTEPNVDGVAWGHTMEHTATEFGQVVDAHREGQARPHCIASSSWGHYASIWRDDRIGAWQVAWNHSTAGMTNQIANYTNQFYVPLAIASHGSGLFERHSAIFVHGDTPLPRTAYARGDHSGLTAFDGYMQNHLQNHGARAGALAITKHGRLVYARAFTLAESGYAVTQPTDRWRIASLTKPVTAAAVYRLVQETPTTLSTLVAPVLGYPYADTRYAAIRAIDLMRHTSGVIDNAGSWTVASWWNPVSPALPIHADHSARYAASRFLNFGPDTLWDYSNHGYITLGRFVEALTPGTWLDYVQSGVLQPLSVTQATIGATSRYNLLPNEVRYHVRELVLEPSEVHTDRRLLPAQYNRNLARSEGSGSLVMSPIDYVRFLAGVLDHGGDGHVVTPLSAHSMGLTNTYQEYLSPNQRRISNAGMTYEWRPDGVGSYTKGGTYEGLSASAIYRTDGVCVAAFTNMTFAHPDTDQLNTLIDAVTTWPGVDRFPSYGYPQFQSSCPNVQAVTNGTLPNVSDDAFELFGTRLDEVQSVTLAGSTITSQDPATWADGWFEVVSPNVLEVHPPQGLAPGVYGLGLASSTCTSANSPVTITLPPTSVLGAAAAPVGDYDMLASLGNHSLLTWAWLALAPDDVPTVVPGIVNLRIGSAGTTLVLWPSAIPVDPATRTFRWNVPDLSAYPPSWFQAALIDFGRPDPFPLGTTNVRLVTQ